MTLTAFPTLPRTTAVRWSTSPSPAWQRVHVRSEARRHAIAQLDRGAHLDDVLAADAVAVAYDGVDDLLGDLVATWTRRVQCRIDTALEFGEPDPVGSAIDATERELPGVHRVLVQHADQRVVARARRLMGLSR